MSISKEKATKIILEIYQELYENSTPKGDFAKMMETGETEREDFFLDYFLEEEKQLEIIENVLKKHKITKEYVKHKFRKEILLGCSPRSVRRD